MTNHEQRQELVKFFQYQVPAKITFATSKNMAHKMQGSFMEMQQSFIFLLEKSSDNIPDIDNDDLLQYTQTWVFETATKSKQEAANFIYTKLRAKYPLQKTNVFCWDGQIDCSSSKNDKGWAIFKKQNNPAYGSDFVIILS